MNANEENTCLDCKHYNYTPGCNHGQIDCDCAAILKCSLTDRDLEDGEEEYSCDEFDSVYKDEEEDEE